MGLLKRQDHKVTAGLLAVAVVVLALPASGRASEEGKAAGPVLSEARRMQLQRQTELDGLSAKIELSKERQSNLKDEIAALERDGKKLTLALMKASENSRKIHDEIDASNNRLDRIRQETGRVRASLAAKRDSLSEVLAILQRMGKHPPPAVLVRPEDALAALRSAILVGSVVPTVRRQAEALATDLGELASLRKEARAEDAELRRGAENLKLEQERIRLLLEEKRKSRMATHEALREERRASAELAGKARSLKELIARMEARFAAVKKAAETARETARAAKERAVETGSSPAKKLALLNDPNRIEPALPFEETKGLLPLPVRGVRLRGFGEPDRFGGVTKGIAIASTQGAVVTAPSDGWVVYAGPFRSYGRLLILNAGGGYHLVLAGMARVDVQLGQFVLTGEPVGLMGSGKQASAASLDLGSTQPVIYVEFRKDGKSIDSAPWWAESRNEKARG